MKKWLTLWSVLLLIVACKEKEAEPKKEFISILSYINNQVADVDTSLYSIIRLDFIDSTRTDTTYIRREDFRALAKDFLSLPDIADKKNRKDYKEETQVFRTIIDLSSCKKNPWEWFVLDHDEWIGFIVLEIDIETGLELFDQ